MGAEQANPAEIEVSFCLGFNNQQNIIGTFVCQRKSMEVVLTNISVATNRRYSENIKTEHALPGSSN